jgi:phosphatidylglycerol lysyltransferase
MSSAIGIVTPLRTELDFALKAPPVIPAPRSLEDFAYRFGRSYDSYLAADPKHKYFWAKNRRGAVAYAQIGKYLNVVGGLLAASEDKPALLQDLVQYANQHGLTVSFYNIAEDELPLFTQLGFQATKWGEDACIDFAHHTWRGKAFEWVRRQSNYCERKGIVLQECDPQELTPSVWNNIADELEEISASRLAGKPQAAEMNFLDGKFDREHLGRKRLFIARSNSRIEGFLICNPCLDGSQWALDVYRQRADAVRGTVPFLIHRTLELLQDEGVERASLCLIPSLHCRPIPGDSRMIRWGLILGRHFRFIFDSRGLYHFKSRFRPRFEERFVCVFPRATPGSIWSFVRLCGVLHLSPRKTLTCGWRCLSNRFKRSKLAKPDTAAQ